MNITWLGRPSGYRNKRAEVDLGTSGGYTFILCNRQEPEDPHLFRLFVYCDFRSDKCGFMHLGGGFPSVAEAKAFAADWEDPTDDNGKRKPE